MSDVTEVPVIGSGKFWPPVKGELVGIARWIVLAWAAQTLILAIVGIWIVVAVRDAAKQAHSDADLILRK